MLDFKEQEAARGVKQRGVWIKPKMQHGRFITAAKGAPIHVIFCIREKIIIDVDTTPAQKVYLPVCDRDLPFEFMLTIRLEPETHKATFIKVPKPFLAHVTDGMVITTEHGRLLMAEAAKGAAPEDNTGILALENAADDSPESLRELYRTMWKHAGPSASTTELQQVTPARALLQKHADRLKSRAARAQLEREQSKGMPTEEPITPGDIGTIVKPNFDHMEGGDDELFSEQKSEA